jgi:hypothetical protein
MKVQEKTRAAAFPLLEASWTMLNEVMPSGPTPQSSPSRQAWRASSEATASTSRRKASELARLALDVGGSDPGILVDAAFVLAYFGEDVDAMIGLVDRALTLNPSFARGWYVSGGLRLWSGQPDLAIEHIETSLRLSPRERIGLPIYVMGAAYFVKRRF